MAAQPGRRDLLAETPDDVLLSVFSHLETARDMASLAGTSRGLNRLVKERGWRIFTRTRFPSLAVPQEHRLRNAELSWEMMAESLTWQSRCWDRRSLTFTATVPHRYTGSRGHHHHRYLWPTVLDAHFSLDTRAELLVWSEGENVCARRRAIVDDGWTEVRDFSRFTGSLRGFQAGKDDVMRLAVVNNVQGVPGRQGVLTLRASGRLDLLAAEHENFGTPLASYHPQHAKGSKIPGAPAGKVPDQSSLLAMDISQKGIVAACNKESVFLYELPRGRDQPLEIGPSLFCDMNELLLDKTESTYLGNVKWIGSDDILALGVKGQYQSQLQYLQLTPSGAVQVHRAVENSANPARFASGGLQQINASSITPVDPPAWAGGGRRPLVLAAWMDGTCRLQDLRTPTPFDAVYEDNVNPESNIEHILAWGGERFVAGGSSDEILRLFDLRWPKPYHHQRALPCRSVLPYPEPPQPFANPRWRRALVEEPPRRACCDHLAGLECTWHRLSRDIYFRPNCNLYYRRKERRAESSPGCVRALAKGSDLSPHFFVGVQGGFLEARLGTGAEADPNLSYEFLDLPDGGRDSGYETLELKASLMETGDGLSVPHNDRNIPLPPFRPNSRLRVKPGDVPQQLQDSHRLDHRYHHVGDFGEFLTWKGSYGTVAR